MDVVDPWPLIRALAWLIGIAGALIWLVLRVGRRERGVVPQLARDYGLHVELKTRGWRFSTMELTGTILDVPIRFRSGDGSRSFGGNVVVEAEHCGEMRCIGALRAHGRSRRHAREAGTGSAALDARARWIPQGDEGTGLDLPEAARDLLLRWLQPTDLRLQRDRVEQVVFSPNRIAVELSGLRSIEHWLAEVIAIVKALEGEPMDREPMDALRGARLPEARAVK